MSKARRRWQQAGKTAAIGPRGLNPLPASTLAFLPLPPFRGERAGVRGATAHHPIAGPYPHPGKQFEHQYTCGRAQPAQPPHPYPLPRGGEGVCRATALAHQQQRGSEHPSPPPPPRAPQGHHRLLLPLPPLRGERVGVRGVNNNTPREAERNTGQILPLRPPRASQGPAGNSPKGRAMDRARRRRYMDVPSADPGRAEKRRKQAVAGAPFFRFPFLGEQKRELAARHTGLSQSRHDRPRNRPPLHATARPGPCDARGGRRGPAARAWRATARSRLLQYECVAPDPSPLPWSA